MKAIQFDRLGGPEVMELREVPKPELQPGTVVVKNRVIALNYGDVFFIQGQYLVKPVFPDTPGMEAAGSHRGGRAGRQRPSAGDARRLHRHGRVCGIHADARLAGDSNS